MRESTRRSFLRTAGAAAAVALAGCSGNGGGGRDVTTVPGSDYPTVDEWLTGSELGDPAGNYDGHLVDWTGQDAVTVDVGAEGNGGYFAFSPPAIVVSTGTEVRWSWTGKGDPHNVEALPEEQLGESDYKFSSGEPESGTGVKFTRTMGKAGVALYHCEPHLTIGMKGGIAVT